MEAYIGTFCVIAVGAQGGTGQAPLPPLTPPPPRSHPLPYSYTICCLLHKLCLLKYYFAVRQCSFEMKPIQAPLFSILSSFNSVDMTNVLMTLSTHPTGTDQGFGAGLFQGSSGLREFSTRSRLRLLVKENIIWEFFKTDYEQSKIRFYTCTSTYGS